MRSFEIITSISFEELTRSISSLSFVYGSGSVERLTFTIIFFVFDALIFLDLDHTEI